jgi:hypothetical protein
VGALRQAKNHKQLNNTMRADPSKGTMSLSLLSVSVSHSLTQSLSLSVRLGNVEGCTSGSPAPSQKS